MAEDDEACAPDDEPVFVPDDDLGAGPSGPPVLRFDWPAATAHGIPDSLQGIPTRHMLIAEHSRTRDEHARTLQALGRGEKVLFQPWDVEESNHYTRRPGEGFGQTPARYQLNLYGVLPDGSKVRVIINDAPVYFGVWLPKFSEPGEREQWIQMTTAVLFEHGLERHELGLAYPLRGYSPQPREYIRLYFPNTAARKKACTLIRSQDGETFSDETSCYFRVLAREHRLSLCDWASVSGYTYLRGAGDCFSANQGRPCPAAHPNGGAEGFSNLLNAAQDASSALAAHVLVVPFANIKTLVDPLDPDPVAEQEIAANPLLAREAALVMTWDIETHSPDKGLGTPPTATKPNDVVFMICCTLHFRNDPKPLAKVCLVTQETAPDSRWHTVVCGPGGSPHGPAANMTYGQDSLIGAFGILYRQWAPEIITGFNCGQYDWPFVVERARQLGLLLPMVDKMSGIARKNSTEAGVLRWNYKLDKLVKINADNRHSVSYLKVPGSIPVDARLAYMRIFTKAPKTSLKYFLGAVGLGGKADMPYTHMWKCYERAVEIADGVATAAAIADGASPEEAAAEVADEAAAVAERMRHVAHYCIIDALRCQELLTRRNVVQDYREFGNLSFTCFDDCVFLAGGHKVTNLLFAYGRASDTLIGYPIYGSGIGNQERFEGKYPGAYVVPPDKGLDEDNPGAGLDFASLYPNIIRAYNISVDKALESAEEARRAELSGEKIHYVSFHFGNRHIEGWFVRHQNDPKKMGVYARALGDLFNKRVVLKSALKAVEGEIEIFKVLLGSYRNRKAPALSLRDHLTGTDKVTAPQKAAVAAFLARYPDAGSAALEVALEAEIEDLEYKKDCIDSKQKAVKVFMNTFYGEAGNQNSPLFYLPLAGGVTAAGRYNLKLVKEFVESRGFTVKYGDTDSLYLCAPKHHYAGVEAEYRSALRALGIVPPVSPAEWAAARAGFDEAIERAKASFRTLEKAAGGHPHAAGALEAGRRRLCQVIESRTREKEALGPEPPEPDPQWLQKIFDARPEVEAQVHQAYRTLCEAKVRIMMTVMSEIRGEVNAFLEADNGTKMLNMAYEEVIFPGVYTGKKKYFGVAHVSQPSFDIAGPDEIFVRGIDIVKQGQTRLSREIGLKCMWDATRLHPPGARVPLIDRVVKVLKDLCSDLSSFRVNEGGSGMWTVEDFVQTDAWKPDKDNKAVQKFMRRMRVRHKIQLNENRRRVEAGLPPLALDYIEPEPGERFSYLLVNVPRSYDLRGYVLPHGKKGDIMEYVHVARKRNSSINTQYYLVGYVVGLCARFINYEERFAPPPGRPYSDKELDLHAQTAAKSWLTKLVNGFIPKGDGRDAARGRSYKKAYESATRRAACAVRDKLGPCAEILVGPDDLADSGKNADRALAGVVDFELFLPAEDSAESLTLGLADRLREAAKVAAARFVEMVEEPVLVAPSELGRPNAGGRARMLGYTERLLEAYGVHEPGGRETLYAYLSALRAPTRLAELHAPGPTHPARLCEKLLARTENDAYGRIDELAPVVAAIAGRMQGTIEELVALERMRANAAAGDLDGDDEAADPVSLERSVLETAESLTFDPQEKTALAEINLRWSQLIGVAAQRLLRRLVVERLGKVRDQAL